MIRAYGKVAAMKRHLGILTLLLLGACHLAEAHFLWVTIDRDAEPAAVNVVFEHGLKPGGGQYIPHFVARGKTWLRDGGGTRELPVEDTRKDGLRWLSADLDATAPFQVASYGLFGVYRYGETDVQLHYYAKHIEAAGAAELEKFARSEQLDLDIVPALGDDGSITLTVLWRGSPLAGSRVTVGGASRFDRKTGPDGTVSFRPDASVMHTVLARFEDPTPGTDPVDGKDYVKIRHQSTLTIHLPAEPSSAPKSEDE